LARSKNNGSDIKNIPEDVLYAGKVPPHSKELEMNVIGGMIIDNTLIDSVVTILKPQHFYINSHALIFRAISDLRDRNEPVDLITLTEEMKSRGELDAIGGPYYLAELSTAYSSQESILFSANKILENWIKRDLILLTYRLNELSYDPTMNTENLLDKAQQDILEITNHLQKKNYTHIRYEVMETMQYVESIHERKEKGVTVFGVPSGYDQLDALTGGFQKSELIIIAGRPSHGKTALALNIARNAAVDHGKNVGIFSIEMSNRELALRFICLESKVDISKLKTGRLPESDWTKIKDSTPKLMGTNTNIIIDDSSPLSLLELRAKSRRMKAQHNIDMVIVDYLQLMEVSHIRNLDRHLEIALITRGLKQLSKELDIPVVALSQLSRKVEDRAGKEKRPLLSDLRESGCLTGDTAILDASTGQKHTIKELAENNCNNSKKVLAVDENLKLSPHKMVKAFYSGQKEVFEIKTRTGRKIKASANHPFLKLQGWTRLDHLNIGDKIASARELRLGNDEGKLSKDEIILIAHLLGDGCILEKQPYHYTSADLENIEAVKNTAKNLFNIDSKVIKQKNWFHVYLTSPYRLTHNKVHPITTWFEKLGLKRVRSYDKKLPRNIFHLNNTNLELFLRHLWATDGNISWKKAGRNRLLSAAIYYATSSLSMAEDVQHLLLRLGIQSFFKPVQNKKGYRTMYHVIISGTENQMKFLKNVGCNGERGKIIPIMINELEKISVNPNYDVIPQEVWKCVIEACKKSTGISWREFAKGINMSYCGSSLFKNGISRYRMNKIYSLFPFKIIKDLAESDIYWDEIISIKSLGVEDVYDITVNSVHNFVANEFIVHNSIEQDADVVLFINRPEIYMSKDDPKFNDLQGLAEIIVGKQRNGPIGEIKLTFINNYAMFVKRAYEQEPTYYTPQETPF
jgi:replicative DNA helicase